MNGWKIALSTIPLLLVLGVVLMLKHTGTTGTIRDLYLTSSSPVPLHWVEEILGLAADVPCSFTVFDLDAAEKKLEQTHVIRKATLRLEKPSTLHVDLQVREPVARIGDYSHTGCDAEGVIMPLLPVCIGSQLPSLYLGPLSGPIWGMHISKFWPQFLLQHPEIAFLDLSRSQHPSLGSREIILGVESSYIRCRPNEVELAWTIYNEKFTTSGKQCMDFRLLPLMYLSLR